MSTQLVRLVHTEWCQQSYLKSVVKWQLRSPPGTQRQDFLVSLLFVAAN